MIYLYPDFDYPILFRLFRIAGAGLGNLLFDFANVLVIKEQNPGTEIIWPEWNSFKLGTYLRQERDKRLYRKLFENDGSFVDGFSKMYLLIFSNKFFTGSKDIPFDKIGDNTVILFRNRNYTFEGLHEYRDII